MLWRYEGGSAPRWLFWSEIKSLTAFDILVWPEFRVASDTSPVNTLSLPSFGFVILTGRFILVPSLLLAVTLALPGADKIEVWSYAIESLDDLVKLEAMTAADVIKLTDQ